MSIESTMTVRRSDAISMLESKGQQVHEKDCCERLSDMLYECRETIFENYWVVEDDYEGDEFEKYKEWW